MRARLRGSSAILNLPLKVNQKSVSGPQQQYRTYDVDALYCLTHLDYSARMDGCAKEHRAPGGRPISIVAMDESGNVNDKAAQLINKALEGSGSAPLSLADNASLIQAVGEDMHERADKSKLDEDRLAKVEAQTQALAEAVIAITDPGDAIAPAVQAVKNEMKTD